MAYSYHRIILIALVFAIAVCSSSGDCIKPKWGEQEAEKFLRYLCNETQECLDMFKSNLNRFTEAKPEDVIGIAIGLAKEKTYEIYDQLDGLSQNSSIDENLKNKYQSCFYSYHRAIHHLESANDDFSHSNFQLIPILIQNAGNGFYNCNDQFNQNPSDPAHIKDINKGLGIFVQFLEVATLGWYNQTHRS